MESLTVSEDDMSGQVEVCVVVFTPVLPCPIVFPFEVYVSLKPDSASETSNTLV